MKLPATFLALLVALPSMAADPEPAAPPAFINADATKAIALVKDDAAAATANSKHTPLTILDVRTPAEFAASHLKGAKNLDFNAATFKADLLKLDKSKPYLVHCGSGNRSAKVRDLMQSLGFARITHLDGGLKAWTKAGGPVVAEGKATAPAATPVESKN